MKVKGKFGVFILACAVIGVALFGFSHKESYSTEAVVDSLWDEYSIQSIQYGDEQSVMSVTVYDEKDIDGVEKYLEDNLSDEDLNDYKFNVYQYSENPKEFRENAQENLNN